MDEAQGSTTTIEIKVLTLDSHKYTLRVDKHVPVPALKERIASVSGFLSEQQRLLCRGRVLKDDQLLSAYNVEDGHTLHLVVREQVPPPSSSDDIGLQDPHPATDTSSSSSVVIETYSLGDQEGDGVSPQISHIVSAVLGSLGFSDNIGSGMRGQYERPQSGGFGVATSVPLGTQFLPPMIPNSLTTLSQYLSHMSSEFDAIRETNVRFQAVRENNVQFDALNRTEEERNSTSSAMPSGFPTPASLAQLMRCTRQMLDEQVGTCLVQLARQMEDQENINNPLLRLSTQGSAWRTGCQLQNLGAYLLELGRTTMTVQLGQTPNEAVVNSGPAAFISPSGPNPLMVQPPLFQLGTSFGTSPMGTRPPNEPDVVIQIQRGSPMDENLGNQTTSRVNVNNQESEISDYDEFLRSLSRGGEINVEDDARLQRMATGSVPEHVGTSSDPVEAEPRVADEGIFLSNVLQEIMPYISQHVGAESNVVHPAETHTSEDHRMVQDFSTQAQNSQVGTSRRRSDTTEPSPPNSKRQKME